MKGLVKEYIWRTQRHGQWRGDWLWTWEVGWVEGGEGKNWNNCNNINNEIFKKDLNCWPSKNKVISSNPVWAQEMLFSWHLLQEMHVQQVAQCWVQVPGTYWPLFFLSSSQLYSINIYLHKQKRYILHCTILGTFLLVTNELRIGTDHNFTVLMLETKSKSKC